MYGNIFSISWKIDGNTHNFPIHGFGEIFPAMIGSEHEQSCNTKIFNRSVHSYKFFFHLPMYVYLIFLKVLPYFYKQIFVFPLLKYSFKDECKEVLQEQSRIIVFSEIPFSKNLYHISHMKEFNF